MNFASYSFGHYQHFYVWEFLACFLALRLQSFLQCLTLSIVKEVGNPRYTRETDGRKAMPKLHARVGMHNEHINLRNELFLVLHR